VRELLGTLLLLGMLGDTGGAAIAADRQVVKLATLIPNGSVWDRTLKTMGADWRQATNGRVQLRIYGGGVAGDDPDLVRKMRIGQLHAATVTVTGLTEIDDAFALFEIPMFFDSYEEFFHVLAEIEPLLEERLQEKGFILLHWGHAGWVHFFTTEPVATLEEFRRLKIFVWAGNDQMTSLWRKHQFHPVPLAATDILTGLKTGMFQALPSTPIAALSLQWFRSTPHMLDLGLTPLLGATVITEKAWSSFAPEDRELLLAAAHRAGDAFREEIPAQDDLAIAEMQERGLSVVPIVGTDSERAWQEAAMAFAQDMREKFVPADIFDHALSIRDLYRKSAAPTGGR
jgi:TRAP-type C4-dicarboxylate transport system substrate-binding protein